MAVLIGCSPSTGSSLLRTILNRHSALFSGAELSLFNKSQLYTDWNKHKYYLLDEDKKRLETPGWELSEGTNLLNGDYGWAADEIQELAQKSNSLSSFAEGFFARCLKENKAKIWIEKTPSNAYCFRQFLAISPNTKVIHICRNPYDTIASLYNRGFNVYTATGRWVYNTAMALSENDNERYLQIFYEELVGNPRETVMKITDFLGVDFEESMIEAKNEKQHDSEMPGWTHKQTGSIKASAVGRFAKLPKAVQQEIIAALDAIQISVPHLEKYQIDYPTGSNICKELHYEFLEKEENFNGKLRWYRWRDMFRRTIKNEPAHLFHYPAVLRL